MAIARIGRAEYDFNLSAIMPAPAPDDIAAQRKQKIVEHSRQMYSNQRPVTEYPLPYDYQRSNQVDINRVQETRKQAKNQAETVKTSQGQGGDQHRETQAVTSEWRKVTASRRPGKGSAEGRWPCGRLTRKG